MTSFNGPLVITAKLKAKLRDFVQLTYFITFYRKSHSFHVSTVHMINDSAAVICQGTAGTA
jgi:hypothetical protein